jgi:hypothetical protein
VFAGSESGHGVRCYVLDLEGGEPRPITPEGITLFQPGAAVSPDGNFVIGTNFRDKVSLYPVAGGEPRRVPGVTGQDVAICWTRDGSCLFVYRMEEFPERIRRLDLSTGHEELFKEVVPADRAGVRAISHICMTPDAKSYIYYQYRVLSNLYLVEGLK